MEGSELATYDEYIKKKEEKRRRWEIYMDKINKKRRKIRAI